MSSFGRILGRAWGRRATTRWKKLWVTACCSNRSRFYVWNTWKQRCAIESCIPDNPRSPSGTRRANCRSRIRSGSNVGRSTRPPMRCEIDGWTSASASDSQKLVDGLIDAWLDGKPIVQYSGVNAYPTSGGYESVLLQGGPVSRPDACCNDDLHTMNTARLPQPPAGECLLAASSRANEKVCGPEPWNCGSSWEAIWSCGASTTVS